MQRNTWWFSMVIAIGLLLLVSLSAFVLLDTIMPFAKNTKGIEQSTSAYYFAGGAIEQALYQMKSRSGANITQEYHSWNLLWTGTGFLYQTTSSGNTIPLEGFWNSEYDNDFNQFSVAEQIQLEVWRNMVNDWNNVNFQFRIPSFTWWLLSLSGTTQPLIHWSLTSENNTLNASGSWIQIIDVNNMTNNPSINWKINDKLWMDLTGTGRTFSSFYNSNCEGTSSWCILKMSLVNNLLLTNGNRIPYLEYKIDFPSGNFVPLRHTRIEASGHAYGYKKDLEVFIPQQTLNQAFDFTIFQ